MNTSVPPSATKRPRIHNEDNHDNDAIVVGSTSTSTSTSIIRSSSLPSLPLDCLCHIISFLCAASATRLALTCRTWYYEDREYLYVAVRYFVANERMEALEEEQLHDIIRRTRFPNLISLDLTGCNVTRVSKIPLVHWESLERLSLALCNSIDTEDLLNLFFPRSEPSTQTRPHHEHCQLLSSESSSPSSFAPQPPTLNLKHLSFAGCQWLTDSFLFAMHHRHTNNLESRQPGRESFMSRTCESLNFSMCERILDPYAIVLCVSLCGPRLRRLNLCKVKQLSNERIVAIAGLCPNLERINLNHCGASAGSFDDSAIVSLAHSCPKLKQIQLRQCKKLEDTGVLALLTNCPGLTRVDFGECTKLTNEAAKRVAEATQSTTKSSGIQWFNFDGCTRVDGLVILQATKDWGCSYGPPEKITDDALRLLAEKAGHRLRVFDVSNCKEITNAGVMAVIDQCPGIERFYIEGCWKLTDSVVVAAFQKLHGLKSISASGTGISDRSLCALADTTATGDINSNSSSSGASRACLSSQGLVQQIETLAFSSFKITDTAIRTLVAFQGLPTPFVSLRELHLKWTNITNESLGLILTRFHSLRELFLDGCKRLDATTELACGEEHEPSKLRLLSLRSCKLFPASQHMPTVALLCPRLEILDLSGCREVDSSVIREVAMHCPDLNTLYLRSSTFSAGTSTRSSSTPSSSNAAVTGATTMTVLEAISVLLHAQIRDLDISHTSTRKGPNSLIHKLVQRCTQLRMLNLSGHSTHIVKDIQTLSPKLVVKTDSKNQLHTSAGVAVY